MHDHMGLFMRSTVGIDNGNRLSGVANKNPSCLFDGLSNTFSTTMRATHKSISLIVSSNMLFVSKIFHNMLSSHR